LTEITPDQEKVIEKTVDDGLSRSYPARLLLEPTSTNFRGHAGRPGPGLIRDLLLMGFTLIHGLLQFPFGRVPKLIIPSGRPVVLLPDFLNSFPDFIF
jgi:hypothetical protein